MTEDANESHVGAVLRDLGRRIRQTRLDRGLSVRDMVINHDYHDAQWRRFENGASLTVPSLIRIAKALGTSLAILLDGVGEFSTTQVDSLKGRGKNRSSNTDAK